MKKIFINGKIYTVTKGLADSFVVEGDKFVYVGCEEESIKLVEKGDEVIDLDGKFVTAGFNDSHLHLIPTGNCIDMVDLCDAHSMDDLIQRGRDFMKGKNFKKDHYIMGSGWNQDIMKEKRFPTRYDLDQISTEYPICFIRACYHIYAVNSKALELSGITADTEQVEGGIFDVDERGEPLGIFRESACDFINSKITPLNHDEIKGVIVKGLECCNSYGVTSVGTDDLSELPTISYDTIIKAFKELEEEGKLTCRINEQSRFHNMEEFKRFIDEGYTTGTGTDLFRISCLKLVADGALGARTAYMNEPYADDSLNKGVSVISEKDLEKWIELGTKNNMQIAIHAIGDAAIYDTIEAYSKALPEKQGDMRHGIVHAQIIDSYALKEMKRLRLIAYIQTVFIDYDTTIVVERLGAKRAESAYRFKTMMDEGILVCNGSDAPVELPDVFKGMQNAVTRGTLAEPKKPFHKEEAFSIEEAIYSYTMAGAYSTFEENKKGSVEAGKLADFLILNTDLLNVNPEDLHKVKVEETYLGGKSVWKNGAV